MAESLGKIRTVTVYTGAGGLAVNAQVSSPVDLVIDKLGNIVFVEYNNHVVRTVNTTKKGAGIKRLIVFQYPIDNMDQFSHNRTYD